MALEIPGWCKRCGEPIEQAERRPGRPREFCGDACRQAHRRRERLHGLLVKEVGLSDAQVGRLLALFKVTERDTRASRSATTRKAGGPHATA